MSLAASPWFACFTIVFAPSAFRLSVALPVLAVFARNQYVVPAVYPTMAGVRLQL